MDAIYTLFQFVLHIDQTLFSLVSQYGFWIYVILFLIIFCETGLIITPFLPGDSLLFAAGSIAGSNSEALNIQLLMLLLILASMLGNKVNYLVGKAVGPMVFSLKDKQEETGKRYWLAFALNQKHLQKAHQFYERHGGKTIILARFLPIIRTFVPFVAGVAQMNLAKFSFYNMISAILWIGSLTGAGYFLGSLPFIKNNFSLVIYGIILVSLLPGVIVYGYRRCSCTAG